MAFTHLRRLLKRSGASAKSGGLRGVLDSAVEGRVLGWAYDRSRPNEPVDVAFVVEDRLVASARADLYRDDLAKAGLGNGEHGFDHRLIGIEGSVEVFAVTGALSDVVRTAIAALETGSGDDGVSFQKILAGREASALRLRRPGDADNDRAASAKSERPTAYTKAVTGGVVLIEIQDLLVFLRVHHRVTGIQRVVCGIITATLADQHRYSNVEFCTAGRTVGEVAIMPKRALLDLIGRVLEGKLTQQVLTEKVGQVVAQAQTYRPTRGDTFVISGAYWIVPDYGRHLLQCRNAGVTVGAYIYDLIPITSPRWVTASTRQAVAERAIDVMWIADYFMTISDFVRREVDALVRWEFGVEKPVVAVPLPHEVPFETAAADTKVTSRRFVLCVCTLEGRKNHILLHRIWSALIRKYGPGDVPDLVLVGKWGWLIDDFRDLCTETNYLDGKIIVKAGLSDRELAELYRDCLLTIFPSFVEGWGLPVGESLAAGKFCLASNATSIPEVGGRFVDYFDPHDYFGALAVVDRALFDEAYRAEREALIAHEFRPRTWTDLTAQFHDSIATLSGQIPPLETALRTPLLEPDRYHAFKDVMSSQTMSWPTRQVKLLLDGGWNALEEWGAWSARRSAALRFFTDLTEGDPITVWLGLSLPAGSGGDEITIQDDVGAKIVTSRIGAQSSLLRLETRAGKDGCVAISVNRSPDHAVIESHRMLFVGVTGIGFHRTRHQGSEARILEAILGRETRIIDEISGSRHDKG